MITSAETFDTMNVLITILRTARSANGWIKKDSDNKRWSQACLTGRKPHSIHGDTVAVDEAFIPHVIA